VHYDEGAEVGYRWFAKTNAKPLFPFGHGLTYTTFDYTNFEVTGGDTIAATFDVTNAGEPAGADVPQLYLPDAPDGERLRLIGFERVELAPGESRRVSIKADPRLLARFDSTAGQWRTADGAHHVVLARNAADPVIKADVN